MKFIFTVAFVLIAAACCNALYHVTVNTHGMCEGMIFVEANIGRNHTNVINIIGHGDFMKQEEYDCTPNCELTSSTLFRPDLAEEPGKNRQFSWFRNSFQCQDLQIDNNYNNWYNLDYAFEVKTPYVFQGHNCYSYYNTTNPSFVVFGNDETGEVYGGILGETEFTLTFSPVNASPKLFTFDSSYQSQCNQDSFTLPDQRVYADACNHIPTELKKLLKFW